MKALVTGATGFIGEALAEGLLAAGWEVNLLVRAANRLRPTGSFNETPLAERSQVFEADLSLDSPVFAEAARGCQVVFHAAAIRNRWGTSSQAYWETNVEGTRRLLQASLGQARRFVYVSSVGVFGHPGVLDVDESFPIDPNSGKINYHRTKAEAETVTMAYRQDIEAVVVRPTITYGPGDWDGMLTRLIALVARGKFVQVGRGDNHLHLTYIQDLVRGLMLAGEHPLAAGETLILSGPASIRVGDLINKVEACLGLKPRSWYIPERPARLIGLGVEKVYRLGSGLGIRFLQSTPPLTRDMIDTLCVHRGFSSALAYRLVGYTPQVTYDEGIARTMDWMAATGLLPGG